MSPRLPWLFWLGLVALAFLTALILLSPVREAAESCDPFNNACATPAQVKP